MDLTTNIKDDKDIQYVAVTKSGDHYIGLEVAEKISRIAKQKNGGFFGVGTSFISSKDLIGIFTAKEYRENARLKRKNWKSPDGLIHQPDEDYHTKQNLTDSDKYKWVEMTPEQIERRDAIIAYTKKYAKLKRWDMLRNTEYREKFVKAYIAKRKELGIKNLSTGSPEENRNLYENLKKGLHL